MAAPIVSETSTVDVLALSMALMHQAKRHLWLSIGLSVTAAAIGVITIPSPIDTDPTWGPVAACLAALLALGSYVMFRRYELRYELTSEAKRLALLERGLGWPLSPATRLRLRNRAGLGASRLVSGYRAAADVYYASDKSPGPARLLDLIHESAFFTFNLFRTLRNILLVVLTVLMVVAAGVGWAALVSVETHEVRVTVGRMVMALIPAVMSVGLVSWSFRLTDLANEIEGVTRELDRLRAEGSSRRAGSDAIDGRVQLLHRSRSSRCRTRCYRRLRGYLNELWAERRRSEQT